MRAAAALAAGRDQEDVAALFKVSLKVVDNWWAKWLAGGHEALVAQPSGRQAVGLGTAVPPATRCVGMDTLHGL